MTPPTARRIAWSLIGALIGFVLLLLALPERRAATTTVRAAPTRATGVDGLTPSAAAASIGAASPLAADHPPAPTLNPATRAIELGTDLHALARTVLARAESGDAEAQYALALVTRECAQELGRFSDRAEFEAFLEGVPRRSGIEPAAYAALQRSRFEACEGFRADPLERFVVEPDWLSRAAVAGHPLARLESELRAPGDSASRDQTALRAAAVAALTTQRPEAFMLLLELEFPAEDSAEARDATPNAIAWWLLACARGYPCGPEARWRREQDAFRGSLRSDLGWEDALLFDLPAHEREQARERAAELDRALDAGEVEVLMPLVLRDPLR